MGQHRIEGILWPTPNCWSGGSPRRAQHMLLHLGRDVQLDVRTTVYAIERGPCRTRSEPFVACTPYGVYINNRMNKAISRNVGHLISSHPTGTVRPYIDAYCAIFSPTMLAASSHREELHALVARFNFQDTFVVAPPPWTCVACMSLGRCCIPHSTRVVLAQSANTAMLHMQCQCAAASG